MDFYWKVYCGSIRKVTAKHRREKERWATRGFTDYGVYFDTEQEAVAFQLSIIKKEIELDEKNLRLSQERIKKFKKKYSITD